MEKQVILFEAGKLMKPDAHNKEDVVYDRNYAYHHIEQSIMWADELEFAKTEARDVVTTTAGDVYVIITRQPAVPEDMPLPNYPLGTASRTVENVIYSIAKINGIVIECFVGT